MNGETSLMKAFTVHLKSVGRVRLLVSHGKHGFKFYATNRFDWKEVEIARISKWDIEVWHREGKGDYEIEKLRSDEAVSRYLSLSALSFLADSLSFVCHVKKLG